MIEIDLMEETKWKSVFTKAVKKWQKTKKDEDKVYVKVTGKYSVWFGSIIYVKSCDMNHSMQYGNNQHITVYGTFDDKSRSQCHLLYSNNRTIDDFVWLKGYDGPTVYKHKKDNPIKHDVYTDPVKNSIGQEITVGDFVVWSSGEILCGHVDKITTDRITRYDWTTEDWYTDKKPIVHIKRIKMKPSDKGGIKKCKTISNIVVIDDKLKQSLMTNMLRM